MIYPVLAVSAVVPSLLLMWFFHARDVYREPPRVLWGVFARGVLIVVPVLLVAGVLEGAVEIVERPLPRGLLEAFLLAAIPEEAFKLLVLWRYAARRPEFDEPMDGVVYGVAASLGFATLENLLYVGESGLGVAVMRALTAVPSHAFLGAIMGYLAGRAKFEPRGRRWLWRAFWIPTVLHGLYDAPLLAARHVDRLEGQVEPLLVALISIAPLVVVGEWIVALRLSRRLRVSQILRWPTAADRPAAAPHLGASIALTVGGAIAASLGGLVALGLTLSLAVSPGAAAEAGSVLAGGALMGLTPLAAGTAVFAWGVKRLNEGWSDRDL